MAASNTTSGSKLLRSSWFSKGAGEATPAFKIRPRPGTWAWDGASVRDNVSFASAVVTAASRTSSFRGPAGPGAGEGSGVTEKIRGQHSGRDASAKFLPSLAQNLVSGPITASHGGKTTDYHYQSARALREAGMRKKQSRKDQPVS